MTIEKKLLNLETIKKLNLIAHSKHYDQLRIWVTQLEKSGYDIDNYKKYLRKDGK